MFKIPVTKSERAIFILRTVLCLLLAAHGWARLLAGGVEPFGAWLNSLGFPFGLLIAYAITAFEIIGTLALSTGKLDRFLAPVFAFIYFVGLILVHAPAGWFVVGLGRNGMEYSVLLITCLCILTYMDWPSATRDER